VGFYANLLGVVLGALRPYRVSLQLEMREGVVKGFVDTTALGR
jgi:hypothetical protein